MRLTQAVVHLEAAIAAHQYPILCTLPTRTGLLDRAPIHRIITQADAEPIKLQAVQQREHQFSRFVAVSSTEVKPGQRPVQPCQAQQRACVFRA
ncbi:hypothetical protein D3C76_665560 [compost metagenome]